MTMPALQTTDIGPAIRTKTGPTPGPKATPTTRAMAAIAKDLERTEARLDDHRRGVEVALDDLATLKKELAAVVDQIGKRK